MFFMNFDVLHFETNTTDSQIHFSSGQTAFASPGGTTHGGALKETRLQAVHGLRGAGPAVVAGDLAGRFLQL